MGNRYLAIFAVGHEALAVCDSRIVGGPGGSRVGGRSFVIGQVPSDIRIGGTFSGSTLWVPLNDVTRIGEFGTLEEWHQVRE
jgi:hypothetical protein